MVICIFGDSIAWGASDSTRGGWVERLKVYLGEQHDSDVYNLGVSGNTTGDLLKRLEYEARVRNPNLIVFAIGINDSQYLESKNNPKTPLNIFEQNLTQLIGIARKFTPRVIFVGLTLVDESKTKPIPWDVQKYYDNDNIQKYDSSIQSACEGKGVLFVPMRGIITVEDLHDGLHPNSDGHNKIYEKIRDFLLGKKLLHE
jgi:lysophospholipase L1-like esterase